MNKTCDKSNLPCTVISTKSQFTCGRAFHAVSPSQEAVTKESLTFFILDAQDPGPLFLSDDPPIVGRRGWGDRKPDVLTSGLQPCRVSPSQDAVTVKEGSQSSVLYTGAQDPGQRHNRFSYLMACQLWG